MTAAEWQVTWFTVGMSTASVILILPLGLGLAWMLARKRFFGKSVVETIVSIPLVLPPVATGLALLMVCGRNGFLGGWLHKVWGIDIVFTPLGVILAMGVMAFPLLVRTGRAAFEAVDQEQEDVAATLGARSWVVWWRVTLPLAGRGIMAGIILAWARALGEFGATIIVAGNIPGMTQTLSLAMYQDIQLGETHAALRWVVVSIALAFVAVWVSHWVWRGSAPTKNHSKSGGFRFKLS
jgi:molybdate transport system permease protein